jgi:hypothetical protein
MTIMRALLLGMSLCIAGCGEAERPPPPPIQDTVFSDMAAAKDKARAVEGTLEQQKQEMDKAIKESE